MSEIYPCGECGEPGLDMADFGDLCRNCFIKVLSDEGLDPDDVRLWDEDYELMIEGWYDDGANEEE